MIRPIRIRLTAVLFIISVTGCGMEMMPAPNLIVMEGRGAWDHVSPELQKTTAEVLYATDRLPENKEGKPVRYGSRRFNRLAYGLATIEFDAKDWDDLLTLSTAEHRWRSTRVQLKETRELDRFPATPWPTIDVDGHPIWNPETRAEHKAAVGRLQQLIAERLALTDCKEAYIYVHGAANAFDEGIGDSAQIWHFLGRRGVPITYSWPSLPSVAVRDYNYDRESGEYTVFHLKQFIAAVSGTPGLKKIHFIAHSRGTDVLMSAMRELNILHCAENPDVRQPTAKALRIGHIVLFAADIDFGVAQQRLEAEAITEACEHLTVYSSPGDKAILIAKWLFASTVRLGTLGLYKLPQRDRRQMAGIHNLTLIDAKVSSGFLGHSYFYSSPAVSSDLILLLRDDLEPGTDGDRPLIRVDDAFWEIRDGYPDPEKVKKTTTRHTH